MNKLSLSFDLNTIVILALILFATVAVIYIYKHTLPAITKGKRRLLIIIRSFVILLFILLISIPTLLRYQPEAEEYIYTVLIDRSKSTDEYSDSIDSVLSDFTKLSTRFNTKHQFVEFNKSPDDNFTDIYTAIKQVEFKSDKDKIFLVSDGNHNSQAEFGQVKQHVYTIPVGKSKLKQENLSIRSFKLDKNQSLKTNSFAQLQIQNPVSSEPINVTLYQNDSLIYKKSYPAASQTSMLNPDLYFTKTGFYQVKVVVEHAGQRKSQNRQVLVSDNRTRVAYVFDQPNLECRFFLNQLSSEQYLIEYIPIQSAKNIDHDIIVASILTAKYKSNFIDLIERSNLPFVLFTQEKLVLNQLGLTIDLGNEPINSILRENNKLTSQYASFYLKHNLSAFPILPAVTFRKMTSSGKAVQSYSLFESKDSPIQLIRKNSINRFLLFSTNDFWRLHFDLQNETTGQNFYTEFVNYFTRLIITGSKNVIQLSLKQNDILPANQVKYSVTTLYPDGQAAMYDLLNIETYHNGQLISELNLAHQPTGQYQNELAVPDSGLIELRFKTIVQNSTQFRRSFKFSIQNKIAETTSEVLNRSLLNQISEATNAELIERNTFNQRIDLFELEKNERIKSSLIKLYFEPLLLTLLILFISFEFWLRKQNKLL